MPSDADVTSPLDPKMESSSDYLKIVESNRAVQSTVPDPVAFADGGKADPDVVTWADEAASEQATDKDAQATGDDAQVAGDPTRAGEAIGEDTVGQPYPSVASNAA